MTDNFLGNAAKHQMFEPPVPMRRDDNQIGFQLLRGRVELLKWFSQAEMAFRVARMNTASLLHSLYQSPRDLRIGGTFVNVDNVDGRAKPLSKRHRKVQSAVRF